MLWLIILVISIFAWYVRPLMPIDETRYLAVAYEMFSSGDYLVPRLNGELYSHKPPLLFWMMNLGWEVFGLNNWWPRILGVIALFLNAHYLRKLSQLIFPEDIARAKNAQRIYLTMFFPLLFSSLVFFDLWLSFFVLLSHIAIFSYIRHQHFLQSALLLGLGIGLGILTKGPVVLLFIITPLLFRKKYSQISLLKLGFIGGAIGLFIALCWVIPAAISGGAEYSNAILWEQTAGRIASNEGGTVSGAEAHARPIWFFIVLLPLLTLPWSLKRSVYTKSHHPFLMAALLPVVLVFSIMSGKQPHYLLPLFPLLALMISDKTTGLNLKQSVKPAVACLCAFATGLLVYSNYGNLQDSFLSTASLENAAIFLLIATLIGLLIYYTRKNISYLWLAVSPLLVISIHLALGKSFKQQYDMQPLALQAREWQDAGFEVAYQGSYHGQLNFIGRLQRPIHEIADDKQFADFQQHYPDGKLIKILRPDEVSGDFPVLPHATRVAELHE
ncbi:MAG: 4-amino-4-deoxy-L-arabinose transferase-like glycosyltransferase [Myxococcota bacterium]|jgi:4-amino-4-deoxy-L-arabinose transferase-like glycosyltransferase